MNKTILRGLISLTTGTVGFFGYRYFKPKVTKKESDARSEMVEASATASILFAAAYIALWFIENPKDEQIEAV